MWIILLIVLLLTVYQLWKLNWRFTVGKHNEVSISELYIYPIKSCRGISLKKAAVGKRGLEGDREFMVVDSRGRFQSQRNLSKLAVIAPLLDANGVLTLEAPDMPVLQITVKKTNPQVKVTVWRTITSAVDQGEEVTEWLSSFLGVPGLRLVYFPMAEERKVIWPENMHHLAFQDAYPFLLTSEESLEDLNARLEKEIPMNRFRPNIVVRNCQSPYIEDAWKVIEIAKKRFHVVKDCSRCEITTTDQWTGEVNVEPLATLRQYRLRKGGIMFGQNLVSEGKDFCLHVGDKVKIVEWKSPSIEQPGLF